MSITKNDTTITKIVGKKSQHTGRVECVRTAGNLVISGRNDDVSVRATIPVPEDHQFPDRFTLNWDVLSAFPSLPEVYVEDDKVLYRLGTMERSHRKLLPVEAMQPVAARTRIPGWEGLFPQLLAAVSKQRARYAIDGVLFRSTPDGLHLVATDGKRLHQIRTNIESDLDVVIPATTLKLVSPKAGEIVSVGRDENLCTIIYGDIQITSYINDGTFPPYDDVIPVNSPIVCNFDTKPVVDYLKSIKKHLKELDNFGLKLSFEVDKLTILSGAGTATFNVTPVNGYDSIEIGFNANYLSDALKWAPTITLSMTTPKRPGLFESGNERHVLMPINL